MSKFVTDLVAAAGSGHGLWSGSAAALTETSWAEVHRRATSMAGRLQRHGIDRGTRVGVLALDPTDVAALIQAILLRGAVVTMLQQPTPQADLTAWQQGCIDALSMLGIGHVVVGEPFTATAAALAGDERTVLSLDDDWGDTPGDVEEAGEDDVAIYQLTSGSTGRPKAVGISHRNLHANAVAMRRGSRCQVDEDVMVSWLPLSHDMGLIGFLLSPMWFGVKTVCVSPLEFLNSPMNWIRLLSDHRGTMTAAPNFAYGITQRRLARARPGDYDLSSMRFALCGAEPINPATMGDFTREAGRFGFPATAIVAAYGMAEATLAVSFAALGEGLGVDVVDDEALGVHGRAEPVGGSAAGRHVALLGQPVSGMQVCVADSQGGALTARHVGELWIRGDAVTTRYVTADGETPATDADGWLHTGDLGYVTDDGQVVVCGRSKDVIIVAGRNLYPSDVERIAELVDGVRRGGVAAFGRVLPGRAEELCVVVESTEGADAARVVRRNVTQSVFAETGIAATVFVRPRGAIPKTASGKVKHHATKLLFAGADS